MEKRHFQRFRDALTLVPNSKDRHALRQFNFMNKEQPASVGNLLVELGLGVRFEKLPQGVGARLEPDTWSEKGFEVVINSTQSRLRQRFSGMHEAAHVFLHSPSDDFLAPEMNRAAMDGFDKIYSADEMIQEFEANDWSDAIIFGAGALSGALGLFGRDVPRLSKHFGFSTQVIERALRKRRL